MTGQNCNTPNIFDFLNLSKLCMKFGNLSAYFILYIQFLLFLLTLKSIKTFQVKTWGKICSIQTRHFYYKSLSKVVCSNSTFTILQWGKVYRTFIIKIFMSLGPIFGYNWQHRLEWPGSITFDVRQYLVISPHSHNLRCWDQVLPKTLNFPRLLTRCIFVLFFSRSDIREERGHQLDTAQTRRHDTITVTEGGDPTDNYLTPDWPVCDNQGLSLVNIEMIQTLTSHQVMTATPETRRHAAEAAPDAYCATLTGSIMFSIHSPNSFRILIRTSEHIPKILLIVWGHNTAILSAKSSWSNKICLCWSEKNLTGHLDPGKICNKWKRSCKL